MFLCSRCSGYPRGTGRFPNLPKALFYCKYGKSFMLIQLLCSCRFHHRTYLQTGHFQEHLSQFICRYDSKSKHWMCLHSWPLAGRAILLKVIGHFREICGRKHIRWLYLWCWWCLYRIVTLIAVCSTPSTSEDAGLVDTGAPVGLLAAAAAAATLLKLRFILAMQWSAGNRRLRSKPWRTDRTLGRCTSCRTNRWDYGGKTEEIEILLCLHTKQRQ